MRLSHITHRVMDSSPHFCDSTTDLIRIASQIPATVSASAPMPFPRALATYDRGTLIGCASTFFVALIISCHPVFVNTI